MERRRFAREFKLEAVRLITLQLAWVVILSLAIGFATSQFVQQFPPLAEIKVLIPLPL